jgi:hypothetical protein
MTGVGVTRAIRMVHHDDGRSKANILSKVKHNSTQVIDHFPPGSESKTIVRTHEKAMKSWMIMIELQIIRNDGSLEKAVCLWN